MSRITMEELFSHLDGKRKKKELKRVLYILVVALVVGYMFIMVSSVRWNIYEMTPGGIHIENPINGYTYTVDFRRKEVHFGGVNKFSVVKDGCLEIPEYIWGMPVKSVSMQMSQKEPIITSVYIPDTVEIIYALCIDYLKEVTGGENVTEIKYGAFMRSDYGEGGSNDHLEKVVLGNKIIEIRDGAFAECTALKELYLGNNVRRIGERAFSGCTSLEEISLGYWVRSIGTHAFDGCASLKNIGELRPDVEIASDAFVGTIFYEEE